MMGDYHVRFCERLRVQFPLPTRPSTVVFHADRATKANAHLAHLQALTHKPMLQLAKEPNLSQRSN
jgi:hypothetical protein